ncbi:helicase [Tardiphaga alba]|uniref:DNA 3'-5' helicase II n=1 Tax=Tardiphaga alba TaxID=340268 RepID=A0ABX8A2P7_9BRAD|nr:ATP-binding domain-containing protein [Tardiphaga alba]QUS37808.1 helicase [Tardiphaga alba]
MTEIIWGAAKKPVASQALAEHIERAFKGEGVLYIGYPVLSVPEGTNSIDALWVSPEHGVVIFDLVEGLEVVGYDERQDELANSLETRLRAHKSLMRGRDLLAVPVVVTFAPRNNSNAIDDSHALVNDQNLVEVLNEINWTRPDLYTAVHSVLQSISSIRRGRRRRNLTNEQSRGAQLKILEDSIANLDSRQSKAVIETVEGVQRIRGLAGSGKTIILALKAAYLHAQHPDWKIAVTFNTRSLKAQFQRLIGTFVVEQTGELPNENLQIINAWGAPGNASRTGVYYQFCKANGIEFLDFSAAKDKFSSSKAFEGVVDLALALGGSKDPEPLFDVILVDEAQDFHPNFLKLCYLALGKSKRLVYAYDELQSLTESNLPPPEELFGLGADGVTPNVVFRPPEPGQPSQDVILEKCYRNSRPVLATAHALGFGIYRDPDPKTGTGLIQMFDQAHLWEEVGYRVMRGELRDGHEVTLGRPPSTSPAFLERPNDVDRLVEFLVFDSAKDQATWLVDQIERNIKIDELNFDDIIVINPDPITTAKSVGLPRKLLFEKGFQSHLAGVDTSSDVFFKADEQSIAFTGIFRAKGNEAGMVYVMNAHDCYRSWGSLGRVRNQIFTAITRSKAWVKVCGVGEDMRRLKEEFERVESHNYELNFVYPTEETRKHLRVLNRDLTAEEKKRIKGAVTSVSSLADDIAAGRVLLEDLPKKELDRLRKLLTSGSANGVT